MKNYFVLVLTFVFVACSRDDSEKDNELPVITISSPDNNQVFDAGATVTISAIVADNKKVGELPVHIFR